MRNTFLTRVLFNTVCARAREVRLRGECPARCLRHLTAHPEPHAPCLTTRSRFAATSRCRSSLRSPAGRGRVIPSLQASERLPGPEFCPEVGQAVPISPNVQHPVRNPLQCLQEAGEWPFPAQRGSKTCSRPSNGFRRCTGKKTGFWSDNVEIVFLKGGSGGCQSSPREADRQALLHPPLRLPAGAGPFLPNVRAAS